MASCTYFFVGSPYHRTDGCHLRVLETLSALGSIFDTVRFFSFRNYPLWPWQDGHIREAEANGRVQLILEDLSPARRAARRAKNLACMIWPERAREIVAMRGPGSALWESAQQSDLLFVNYLDGLTQLPWVPDRRPIVVDMHDIGFLAAAQRNHTPVYAPRIILRLRKEL